MLRKCKVVRIEDWSAHERDGLSQALEDKRRHNRRRKRLKWSKRMLDSVVGSYGRWLTWARQQDWYHLNVSLEFLLTPERVEAFVQHLEEHGNAPATIRGRVTGLERMLCALAPACPRGWLLEIRARFEKTGDRAAKRARLQFTDDLIKFAAWLAEQAEQLALVDVMHGAVLFRTALQIMMLAYRPMRLKNFTQLRLHHEVRQAGEQWMLDIPASATKRGNEYDPVLPGRVVELLLRFRDHHRLVLGGSPVDDKELWLFPDGQPQTARSIYYHVSERTKKHFGRPMAPHLFRDAIVTTVATYMPEHTRMSMHLIGNRDPACVDEHYNQAQRHIADQKYNAVLDAFQDGL